MQLKRGMKPFRPDAVPLKFSNYLNRAKLPIVPPVWGHVRQAQPPISGGWGMLGNDEAGDCAMAGPAHEHQTWCWATGKTIPNFTTASVLADYSLNLVAQGGRPFDPNDSSTDTGLDPVATAKWRQTVGLTDADGGNHKIGPFVQIDSLDQVQLSGYLFGCVGICWALPDTAEAQFDAGHVWDDLSGAPGDGHYTELCGRNSKGNSMIVTWGALQAVTNAYINKYMTGALCYLSEDYLLATGKSPEGINWAALADDQYQI